MAGFSSSEGATSNQGNRPTLLDPMCKLLYGITSEVQIMRGRLELFLNQLAGPVASADDPRVRPEPVVSTVADHIDALAIAVTALRTCLDRTQLNG